MNGLAPRQQQVLGFMLKFLAENDQLPPMSAIAKHFGFKSSNAAQEHMFALQRKGFIERNAVGNYRFVRGVVLEAVEEAQP